MTAAARRMPLLLGMTLLLRRGRAKEAGSFRKWYGPLDEKVGSWSPCTSTPGGIRFAFLGRESIQTTPFRCGIADLHAQFGPSHLWPAAASGIYLYGSGGPLGDRPGDRHVTAPAPPRPGRPPTLTRRNT
ncbi:hypothetical protein Kpho01_54920 [Kitasatospora phosalacinea]|uniref:Uncharacterized protein n=1 Tax=Kitasatospora phosalacinea TaxID=2065 RepID=A0A9W6PME2_9ACTN|nr:hypothetical protein Kpho01_54920 [Kitasatospora phosalacinea]